MILGRGTRKEVIKVRKEYGERFDINNGWLAMDVCRRKDD